FEVSSVLGEGSKFTFSLKLADLNAEDEGEISDSFDPITLQAKSTQETASAVLEKEDIPPAAKQTTFIAMNRDRPVLLIVDDDPVNLQVLEAILPPDNYDVTMAPSGKEALAMLDTKEWDLGISD
ncbi:response regulator, partial [Clostridium perfringens]